MFLQDKIEIKMSNHATIIAAKLAVAEKQVIATIELLDEGATVPFIYHLV